MSKLRRFINQTIIYGFSTILARVLNFILTPIYVRLYEAKVYGIFTYLYSWASILNALLAFGMETTFFRYFHKDEDRKERVYHTTFLVVGLIACLFLAFNIFFVEDVAAWMQARTDYDNKDFPRYVKYFVYILVMDALVVIPFAKLRADGRPIRYGIIKLINIFTFVGFNFIFLFLLPFLLQSKDPLSAFLTGWYRPGWIGYVFISNLLASSVTLLLLLPELLKLRLQWDIKLVTEMFLYSVPILIANISFVINENVDKIFLGLLLPESTSRQEIGIYGACCKLAIFLNIFIQAFRLGAEPFFFSYAKADNAKETYARIMTLFVIMISIIFITLAANIEFIKYFIKGSPTQQTLYWSGLKVVPILLLGYVSLGIYMNLSIWYKLSDQTRFAFYIAGTGALLTVILNIIFIPRYGYMACAWISFIAYSTMMILSYVIGQKKYPIPYHLKKNLAYLASAIVVVFLSFVVFKRNILIGNILLGLYGSGVFYIERGKILKPKKR